MLDFYKLNRNFSGVKEEQRLDFNPSTGTLLTSSPLCLQLEVLHLLTPKQLAEMLLLPLPTPPEKHVVIDSVMDFLLETPFDGRLMEILHLLAQMAEEVTTV